MAKGTMITLPSIHLFTFVWQARRELRIEPQIRPYLSSTSTHFFSTSASFSLGLGSKSDTACASLIWHPPQWQLPPQKAETSQQSSKSRTVNACAVLLSHIKDGTSFLRFYIHLFGSVLIDEGLNPKRHYMMKTSAQFNPKRSGWRREPGLGTRGREVFR